ncbi:MAG: type II secretion system protein [Phycisphaerae bacterium]|nr:type II secretion system protein [Phycisphaerae bacterium]
MKHARRAFTLIELLVVIAVISLLVSIILPSLSRAKGLAKTVVCAANAKGIGTAMYIYAEEFNERYPLASNVGNWGEYVAGVTPSIYSWMEQLFPYVEVKKLYVCPEKPNGSEYSYFLGTRAAWIDSMKYPDGPFFNPVIRSRIKYTSAYVLLGCTGRDFKGTYDDCDKDDYTQDCTGFPVHDKKVQTILFPDNHVKSYPGYVEGEMTFQYNKMVPWEEE